MWYIILSNINSYLFILDWDRFVFYTIQLWEEFYIQWIVKGKNILIIRYENLNHKGSLNRILREVCNFLDFPVNKNRLKCALKNEFNRFRRKKQCLKVSDSPSHGFINEQLNNSDIFSQKHKLWINAAIRNVNTAICNRKMKDKSILSYTNAKVKFNICKE